MSDQYVYNSLSHQAAAEQMLRTSKEDSIYKLNVLLEHTSEPAHPDATFPYVWTLSVKCPQGLENAGPASNVGRLDEFVRHVTFYLHDTFETPVQKIRSPDQHGAYRITESGYGSIIVQIAFQFKNGDKHHIDVSYIMQKRALFLNFCGKGPF